LTYERIYESVWGESYNKTDKNAVWAAVGRLRENIKSASESFDYIETVYNVGYRFRLIANKSEQ
jgi:DNA-binding response OmpR family regulator